MSTGEEPLRLRELLQSMSRRMGWGGGIESGKVWSRWNEIVGPGISDHASPSSLRDGVLRVRADSPIWATEVGYLSRDITRRINEALGAEVVKEMKVWTGPAPARGRPSNSAPGAQGGAVAARSPSRPLAEDPMTALERAREAWAKRRR